MTDIDIKVVRHNEYTLEIHKKKKIKFILVAFYTRKW